MPRLTHPPDADTWIEDFREWIDQLAAEGLDRRVAHRLVLITVVVAALAEMPSFRDTAVTHIEAALADPDTFEAVQVALVEPDLDHVWDTLATHTAAPINGRCRALARLCRRNGLQVVAS